MVASWLVLVQPGRMEAVRSALGRQPGIDCRAAAAERLVVVTESSGGLEPVHRALVTTRGVRDAALVAAFSDEDES